MKKRVEEILADDLRYRVGGYDRVETEYTLPEQQGIRRWRWDVAIPAAKMIVDIQGNSHTRRWQMRIDCGKQNFATALGYKVFVYPSDSIVSATKRQLIVDQLVRVAFQAEDPQLESEVM